MRSLPLLSAALLALAGCAHGPPPGGAGGVASAGAETQARCELVQAIVHEPVPTRLREDLGSRAGPAPVMVFLREDGLLERFFPDGATCGDADFSVLRESPAEALVLYLEPTPDGGFTYEARRSSPDALVLDGPPTGRVSRTGAGWVTATDTP